MTSIYAKFGVNPINIYKVTSCKSNYPVFCLPVNYTMQCAYVTV